MGSASISDPEESQQPQPAAAPPPVANPPSSAVAATPAPVVVAPQRRGGLAGIVDEFRDAIAGTTTSKVYTDTDGNKYIKHPQLTHGQQWLRIASDLAGGAAAGEVAGQGRGGGLAAGARGFEAGEGVADKQHQQDRQREADQNEEINQAQLQKFNAVKLKHDIAANEFALQRMKVKATDEDITFAQQQIDREHALHSADLGIYKDEADLSRVKAQHPEFWKDVYANSIVAVPELNEKGERTGIHLFLRTHGIGSQPVEPGTSIKVFTPGKGPNDPPTLVDQVPTVPMTHDEKDAYDNAATAKYQQFFKDRGEEDLKAAQTEHAKAAATQATAGAGKDRAETGRAIAETKKIEGETTEAARASSGLTGEEFIKTLPADRAALVRAVGTGHAAPERIAYLLGRGQTKESKQLLADVTQAFPEVDTSKLAAYPQAYKDFTSGKTSTALNSGATALVHLHELQQLNTVASHIAHTPAWTAYQNKADTVATELAKFYGDATIPAIKNIKDTLTSTLPGNRDSAIRTQAKSMGDKFDSYEQQWKNAAPSESYQAKMPGVSLNAKQARAALDPDYAERLKAEEPQRPAGVPSDYVHRDGPQGVGWYNPKPGK